MPDTGTRPLPSFADLRYLALTSATARACIQVLKNEIRFAEWDISPGVAAARAAAGDRTALALLGTRRSEAVRFFREPARHWHFGVWLDRALEDVLVTDSLAIFLRRTVKPGCGLLGSDLSALDLTDGTTILPVPGPSPPFKVTRWRQYPSGVRRTDLATLLADPAAAGCEPVTAEYGPDELLCRPFSLAVAPAPAGMPFTRADVLPREPFGRSPLEKAIAYGDDGRFDLVATEAKMPGAFGIRMEALGAGGHGQPALVRGDLGERIRDWLKGIFDGVLHETCRAPDLEWLWREEGDDA